MRRFSLSGVLLGLLTFLLGASASAKDLDEATVRAALPAYEAYVEKARVDWGVPSVAVAVVYEDRVIWWKGFGEEPLDRETVFAIGSTTKAFAATTLAMMVDGGGPGWDARVVDHLPEFAMFDPWVTREMRVADLLAQHSGLRPQALSMLGAMGYSRERIWQALRWVEPVTSFRSSYAYVNSPHLVAGELVASWAGADSWEAVLKARILEPLGMTSTTWTEEGLEGNPNHAHGHARVGGEVKRISAGPFPYVFGPAGGLNSNLEDMSRWVRFQLGNGTFEGQSLVDSGELEMTRTPQTIMNPTSLYCMGWLFTQLQGHRLIWHNGGTPGHTTFVGIQPEEGLGLIVLSNLGGTQMPDAVGLRFFDLVRGHQGPDYNAILLARDHSRDLPATIESPPDSELFGEFDHPALGRLKVNSELQLRFEEPGVTATLEPIGTNLYRLRFEGGWLEEIGWKVGGEALFTPAGLSEPASLSVFLGDSGEGAKFRCQKVHIAPTN